MLQIFSSWNDAIAAPQHAPCKEYDLVGLLQDCSNSSALALESLQFCSNFKMEFYDKCLTLCEIFQTCQSVVYILETLSLWLLGALLPVLPGHLLTSVLTGGLYI